MSEWKNRSPNLLGLLDPAAPNLLLGRAPLSDPHSKATRPAPVGGVWASSALSSSGVRSISGELCATAPVAVNGMDTQGPWRAGTAGSRLSYKNATLALCAINALAVALLLRNHFSAWPRLPGGHRFDSAQLRYIWESEEMRRAMEPVDLIRRVKEIEQESYGEHGMSTQEDPKQTAAVDLSNRLKDLRQGNDGSSQRALEEWRKRKMERARQRAIDKDGMMPGGAKTR